MAWEPGSEVVEDLVNLVNKALVAPDHAGRWRLLETVRAYALEKLAESGEAGAGTVASQSFKQECVVSRKPGVTPRPGVCSL